MISKQRISKVKKEAAQSIMRQKGLQKYHCLCVVLALYCSAWDLLFSVIYISTKTPLQKRNFSFVNSSLGDSFWVRVEPCVCFPSQHWDPI